MLRQFWAELLLGAVLAVLAIMFLSGSFTPSKDAQVLLADSTNQSMTAVKTNIQTNAPAIVSSADVIKAVSEICTATNTTTRIYVKNGAVTYGFYQSANSVPGDSTPISTPATAITTVCSSLNSYYSKVQSGDNITYTLQ